MKRALHIWPDSVLTSPIRRALVRHAIPIDGTAVLPSVDVSDAPTAPFRGSALPLAWLQPDKASPRNG
jgi:hypothetical protein